MTRPLRLTLADTSFVEPGDMMRISGQGRPMRLQRGGDGSLYAYPDWPGRNRHERRGAAVRARRMGA